jgi:ribosomal protein S13
MTENAYRLARDIRGIGFKTADAIAMKLGIEKTAMMRISGRRRWSKLNEWLSASSVSSPALAP